MADVSEQELDAVAKAVTEAAEKAGYIFTLQQSYGVARDAIAALTELQARRAAEASEGWRTIESAPKNGERVIVGWKHSDHVETARYIAMDWLGDDSGYWMKQDQPTHWQPLPSSPRSTRSPR